MNFVPPVQLVAIVGGSGAGKSWFVARLCQLLGDNACHLQLDHFYRDRSHLPPGRRAQLNYDIPDAIDWVSAERVLRECRRGEALGVPRYDFATHCRLPQPAAWQPRPLVLVDGLWLLRRPAWRKLYDLRIYLDTPTNLRCSRRMVRDVAERGYPADAVRRQLRTQVVPMHARYVEPQKKWADVVLTQPFQESELAELANRLWAMLRRGALVPPWMHETFRAELLELILRRDFPPSDGRDEAQDGTSSNPPFFGRLVPLCGHAGSAQHLGRELQL